MFRVFATVDPRGPQQQANQGGRHESRLDVVVRQGTRRCAGCVGRRSGGHRGWPHPHAAGEVAVHENHLWATKQGRFSRFDIEQSVEVSFASDAGSSRPFGPYRHLSGVDGVLYAEQRVLAFYDEQQKDWYAFEDGRHWRCITITPASAIPRGHP